MTGDAMSHDVISAFIDHEPFDPRALADALADPEGRNMLIDFVALRLIVDADVSADASTPTRGPRMWWRALAAAALALALGGAYAAGHRVALGAARTLASDVAPAPTRVIDLRPGIEWHTNGGH
jgi:hypothetical protein